MDCTIIWDWNGTLLDDVDICLEGINLLLRKRKHRELTLGAYRSIFTFPVKDYYEKAGFNFEVDVFDELAIEFIDHYHERLTRCQIFPDALPVLNGLKKLNFNQMILSAMEQQALERSVHEQGIVDYFSEIAGISDHFAQGKLDRGLLLLKNFTPDKKKTWLIGDTLHDLEVAKKLGVNCVLVARGHQAFERLARNHDQVVHNLTEATEMIISMCRCSQVV